SLSLARYDGPGVAGAACRQWAVTIWRTGPQVTVELDDGRGQTVVRRVSDAHVAAAVVDSWLHEERAPAAPPAAPPVIIAPVAEAPPPRGRDAWTIAIGPEVVAASDGSSW